MKVKIKTWVVLGSVLCLVGCGREQPWAIWQKVSAKSQSLGQPTSSPRFLASNESGEDASAITLHFDFDQASLTDDDKSRLNELVSVFGKHATRTIRLEGYTDERGSREYNVALGWRRAKAVSQYLIQHGVAPNRLDLVSYGPEKPVSSAHAETAWKLNRRVELAIGEYQ